MIISKVLLSLAAFVGLLCVPQVESENILFYFGTSIYSHRVAVWPLVLELAEKGHQVTFLSPFKSKELGTEGRPHANVQEFRPKSLELFVKEKEEGNKTRDVITSRVKGFSDGQTYWEGTLQNALEICRVIFRSAEVQKWVEDSQFDLVIIDTPYNECALGLAFKLHVPHILYGATSLYMWHQEMFGLPDETSWLPNYYYHFPTDMTFFQRVKNALVPLQWSYSTNRVSYIMPQLESLMRKALNISEMPKLDELEKSTSLFLLNTHFTQEYPRSLPPFVVPVGGMHCEDKVDDEPLDQAVSEFLEAHGDKGFIYISFGSLGEFSRAPPNVIEKFINAFKVLEYTVLWKWDDMTKVPENKPKNVYMSKWFQQRKLLEHPKLKAFITHGGVISHQEAIYHGVPVIVFPLTPEEDYNAELIEKSVVGIRLNIVYFTQYELTTSIKKITTDETYRANIKRMSMLFKDRPQSPVQTALWWTEYVLRHKNLTFIKTPAINQPWYQRRMLDVWGFLCVSVIGSIVVCFLCINQIFCTKAAPPKVKPKLKAS